MKDDSTTYQEQLTGDQGTMGFLFSRLIRNIVIAYVIFSGIQYLLRWKTYNISPKEFRNIASKAQGADNVASAVSRLTTDLRRAYGPAIAAETSWVALSLGSLPLKALFLHASLTEFIGVIGTPFPTSGRVGMQWSNSTCTVLTGSVARLSDVGHMPNKETFSAGGNFRHGQFESHIYSFGADTYVVCYGESLLGHYSVLRKHHLNRLSTNTRYNMKWASMAVVFRGREKHASQPHRSRGCRYRSRGVMPVSGLWAATGALANGEPFSLARLIYTYGHESFNQLSLALTHTFNYYKSKATGKSEL
ncbi:hypothetical protein Y032_0105g3704 [Ancylostoma ceylanicum]|uniref:Sigma non-opioid intracellular receptor 1 n=1 Tax=Ancylostoma ceylanicum TaxID=53326 RepID=A0A016TGB2_9BILA|nr:hypothetical protein Y032_0105g3704 [Ancylostoma ceylanicum]